MHFGDASADFDSYDGGRYLNFRVTDLKVTTLPIDFNKAYNFTVRNQWL